ncbi:diguanylate cyclase domain-containing protein [Pseudomonadota bacterium]
MKSAIESKTFTSSITSRYRIALGLIAILSCLSYLSLSFAIKEEENSSTIINLSGRQRMLSQHIVLVSSQLITAKHSNRYTEQKTNLLNAIQLMKEEHGILIHGHKNPGSSPELSPEMKAIYFTAPHEVNKRIDSFLMHATAFSNETAKNQTHSNPHYQALSKSASGILKSLDAAVAQYELESKQKIAQILVIERTVLGITLLVLLLEAFFIFRPTVLRLGKEADALISSVNKFLGIASSLGEGLIVTDPKGVIQFVNPAASESLGWKKNELLNKKLTETIDGINTEHSDDSSPIIQGSMPKRVDDTIFIRKNGEPQHVTYTTNTFQEHGEITQYIITFRDISTRKKHEEQIQHFAYHDYLTNLPNRRLFTDRLNMELARAKREQNSLAIMFLDLDRFKEINDQFGHDTGDEILQETARRIQLIIRESDTVARMGGDEFILLLPKIEQQADAATIAQKIVTAIAKPVTVGDVTHSISTSAGISFFPTDGDDHDTLVAKADYAMYCIKKRGKNNFMSYAELKKHKTCPQYSNIRSA